MRKLLCIACAVVLTFSALSAAPILKKEQLGFRDWLGGTGKSSFGLLDPSRLTISHNVSFGFTSGGGQSLMQSLYMTQFEYRLSNPLTLSVLLGIQNNQYTGNIPVPGSSNSIMGGFALDYRPRKDIFIHFEMLRAPGNLYYNNPSYRRVNNLIEPPSSPVDDK